MRGPIQWGCAQLAHTVWLGHKVPTTIHDATTCLTFLGGPLDPSLGIPIRIIHVGTQERPSQFPLFGVACRRALALSSQLFFSFPCRSLPLQDLGLSLDLEGSAKGRLGLTYRAHVICAVGSTQHPNYRASEEAKSDAWQLRDAGP